MRSLENQHKCIFTLGLAKENIVSKIILRCAGIKDESGEIEKLTQEGWLKLTDILDNLSRADIHIDEKSSNLEEIKASLISHLDSGHFIDEIVIIGNNSNKSLNIQLINLAEELKKSITFSFEI